MAQEKKTEVVVQDAAGRDSPPIVKVNIGYLAHITGYHYDYIKSGSLRKAALPKIEKAREIMERNLTHALAQAKMEYERLQQEEGGEVCV